MDKKEEPIGLIAFSKFLGLSNHQTVMRALEAGKISKRNAWKKGTRWYILPEAARKEWAMNHKDTGVTPPALTLALSGEVDENADAESRQRSALQKAKEAKEVYQAQLAKLEYETKSGQMVRRDEVNRALAAAGKEIKNALLNIPDRVIDLLIAQAHDRAAAYNTLRDAIEEELQALSDLHSRTFKTNDDGGN